MVEGWLEQPMKKVWSNGFEWLELIKIWECVYFSHSLVVGCCRLLSDVSASIVAVGIVGGSVVINQPMPPVELWRNGRPCRCRRSTQRSRTVRQGRHTSASYHSASTLDVLCNTTSIRLAYIRVVGANQFWMTRLQTNQSRFNRRKSICVMFHWMWLE